MNIINNEGTFPLGFELVLLLGEAKNEFANVISFGPYFSALISSSLLLIECGTGLLRRAPPPRHLSCPADLTWLPSIRTCARDVSHGLCRRVVLLPRRTP